jgi:hypothetical protein
VGQIFTILLILAGAGTALYTFGVILEALIEGIYGSTWSVGEWTDTSAG